MLKMILQCNECDQVIQYGHRCDGCGSYNVETVTHVNLSFKKPKKESWK